MQRVLILEDSPTQSEKLRIILDSEGFEVVTAPDARLGLEYLASSKFDLTISDIIMPGMSGYDFCKEVKRNPMTRRVPVILLTTLSDPMDIIQGLESGADNFITKPYDPAYLLDRVKGILDNKRMRAEENIKVGVEIIFLGKRFTINSEREQILDLLVSTFEDIVRTNRELQSSEKSLATAKAKIEEYAKRLEGRVRESDEKYRSLMEQANDAIFFLDLDGKTLEVNPQTEKLFSTRAADIIGKRCFEFVIPAERDYAILQFQKLAVEGSTNIQDLHLGRKGDEHLCANISASMVQIDGERIVIAIAHDVTERNRLQHQVLQNEKLAVVGTLAAGIAHEINNPTAVILANMGVVKGYTGKLKKTLDDISKLAEAAPEALRREIESICADSKLAQATLELDEVIRDCTYAAERTRDIVRDLKGFARIDEGDNALVSINDCLDTALRMTFNETRFKARLEKNFSPNLPEIIASPGKLHQVFLNIIVNAAQAIGEGHVDRNRIVIATRFENKRIRVDIKDTGKGIPKELVHKIFDPFFTSKPVNEGTGLGLSICQDIIKKHNGEIHVESEIDHGTTFSIFLPLDTGLILPVKAVHEARSEVPRSNILVVDDEVFLLRAYYRMLGQQHDVTTATGGRAAMELLSTGVRMADIIFCDLMMPDIDGKDLYRYIAEKFPGLEQRMVFMSGGAFTARVRDFLAQTDNHCLEKPFVLEDLQKAIAAVHAKLGPAKQKA